MNNTNTNQLVDAGEVVSIWFVNHEHKLAEVLRVTDQGLRITEVVFNTKTEKFERLPDTDSIIMWANIKTMEVCN